MDLEGVSMAHMSQMTPSMAKKMIASGQVGNLSSYYPTNRYNKHERLSACHSATLKWQNGLDRNLE